MLWLCSIGFAADTVLPYSHRGILYRLTHETIVAAMENGLSLPDAALGVTIHHSPLNDAVRTAIPRPFLERKIDVYFSSDSVDTLLIFSLDEATLTYGTPFSPSFLGSKKVERTISVQADITLMTKSAQKVLFSSKFTQSATDTVMLSEVNLLDDPSVPFTAVILPATSFFDSVIEPAIITIASAVAVYLFFTIRS